MAANVSFVKGLREQLPDTYVEGRFLVTTDERAIYLDLDSESNRIRLGDFQEVQSLEDLRKITKPSTTALYYIKDDNILAKYEGSDWKQINPDTGATGVETEGVGNAVTGIEYDAATRKLKVKLAKTFVEESALEEKFTEKLGDLSGSTVKDYVDEKTKDIASEGEITGITTRLAALEGAEGKEKWDQAATDVDTIKGDYLKTADKTALEGKIDGKQDKLQFQTEYNAEDNKVATMSDVAAAVSKLSGAMHWIGTVETKPDAESGAGRDKGDVVTYQGVEYAWDGSAWQELGDESKYSAKVTGWDEAAAQKHTHANSTELEKIQDGDKEKWDTAAGKADTNASDIAAIKDDETIDSFGDVKTELDKKADSTEVTALVGSVEGIEADTIQQAAKEAEEYADGQIAKALTWGEF